MTCWGTVTKTAVRRTLLLLRRQPLTLTTGCYREVTPAFSLEHRAQMLRGTRTQPVWTTNTIQDLLTVATQGTTRKDTHGTVVTTGLQTLPMWARGCSCRTRLTSVRTTVGIPLESYTDVRPSRTGRCGVRASTTIATGTEAEITLTEGRFLVTALASVSKPVLDKAGVSKATTDSIVWPTTTWNWVCLCTDTTIWRAVHSIITCWGRGAENGDRRTLTTFSETHVRQDAKDEQTKTVVCIVGLAVLIL